MLKVTAKDFGPIIDGTVELKPLTVFMGPSNTGKSYMATLIYSFMKSMEGFPRPFLVDYDYSSLLRRVSPQMISEFHSLDNEVPDDVKEAVNCWLKESGQSGGASGELPGVIQEYLGRQVGQILETTNSRLSNELQRSFGGVSDLDRRTWDDSALEIKLMQDHPLLALSYKKHNIDSPQVSLFSKEFDLATGRILGARLTSLGGEEPDYLGFIASLAQHPFEALFEACPNSSFYLPASRSGMAEGYKIIASSLIRNFASPSLVRPELPTLTGITADYVGQMLTMSPEAASLLEHSVDSEAEFIELKVLKGKVYIESVEPLLLGEMIYEPFEGQPHTGKFPIRRASSMVTELAPVILFLKYLVRPADLLILEEPESHLHPASQRQMARAIVRLVNAGVKVIITTHSDYFVSQLNNLMRISYASDRWLKGKGFERADCLKHAEVSAYAFRWDDVAEGSRINELEIRKDVGIDEDEFALVANDLYEETINFQRIRVK